jgi:CubicO group peptidase (beta-lactamase class C family)
MGLADKNNAALTAELLSQIGPFGFSYLQPLPAGGLAGSANDYSGFLRRILKGELVMSTALGSGKVCTNPLTCATAVNNPIPYTESWNYSLGHWVEDDPKYGDGAFSSAGAFGFYPWIDKTRTFYGILARQAGVGEGDAGYHSAQCGRLIRQAWKTGKVVTATTPTPTP